MNKQTIQASGLSKKPYAKPQMQAYQIEITDIICTSSTTQNEEYDEVSSETTNSWF